MKRLLSDACVGIINSLIELVIEDISRNIFFIQKGSSDQI